MTVLSVHPAKILTTGEGGAVLTDRDDLAATLRRFRNHGIGTELAARRDWTYAMVELGYNYRLTDIAAALGRAQAGAPRGVAGKASPTRRSLHGSAGRRSVASSYLTWMSGQTRRGISCSSNSASIA